MKCACMGCTEATGRSWNCHTRCDSYKEFQAKNEDEKKCFKQEQEGKKVTGLSIDVIKNQIRLSKMFAGSEAVSTKALKELLEYKETGLTPQDIKEMDNMYLEKCQQVNRLTCTCEMYERMAKHG